MKKYYILIFLCVSAFGYADAALPLSHLWQTYTFPEGKFQIDFPAKPKSELNGDYKTVTAQGGKLAYQAVFIVRDASIEDQSESLFRSSLEIYGKIQGDIQELRGVNGLIGRQATVKNGLSTFFVQSWQSTHRTWTLACGKQIGKPKMEEAEKFFASFQTSLSMAPQQTKTTVQTNANTTSTASKPQQNLKSYINSLIIPDVDYLSKAQNWYGATLSDFIKLDAPRLVKTVNENEAAVAQTGYSGKKAIAFATNIQKLQTVAPAVIEKYLQTVKNTPAANYIEGKTRIAFLNDITRLADDFVQLFPGDAALSSVQSHAKTQMQTLITSAPFISSPFHVSHMNTIVLFTSDVQVGQEASAGTSQVIAPNQGSKAIAYFSKNLLNSANAVHLNITVKGQYRHVQKLFYWQTGIKEAFAKTGYTTFNFFPDVQALSFKSPYQFDPHINVLAYLLTLPEGMHELELAFELGRKQNMGGDIKITQSFTLDLSAGHKARIQKIHDALLQKRIATLVLPNCTDNSDLIGNKEGFEKYGKLLKYTQTDPIDVVRDQSKIGKPVIGKNTGGWAAVERPDGTVELLKIGLSMPNGQSFWKFTSLNTIPDAYDLKGAKDYIAGKGTFGYLMKKENVAKCTPWE